MWGCCGKDSRRRCLPHHPWCSLQDAEAEDSLEGTSFEPFYTLLSVHLWVYASCDTSGRLHLGQPGTFRGPWGSDSISPCFLPKNLQGGLWSELLLRWRQHLTPFSLVLGPQHYVGGAVTLASISAWVLQPLHLPPQQAFAFLAAQMQSTRVLLAKNLVTISIAMLSHTFQWYLQLTGFSLAH